MISPRFLKDRYLNKILFKRLKTHHFFHKTIQAQENILTLIEYVKNSIDFQFVTF